MFSRIKTTVALVFVALVLVSFTVLNPSSTMFGRHFIADKDFTCCKGDQLYIHHYYEKKVFWVTTDAGYTVEPLGKPTTGCNVQCDE